MFLRPIRSKVKGGFLVMSLSLLAINCLIIWFGIFGLLGIAANPELTQMQIVSRGLPYTLVLIASYGVFRKQQWARLLMLIISILGLALQIIEISIFPDTKDIVEALVFIIFILFFTSKSVKSMFSF